MQYLDYKTESSWQAIQLTKYSLLVMLCLLIWFLPATHGICAFIDTAVFRILNTSLLYSHKWQLLWGYLNHPVEGWLNIFLMVAINVVGIFSLPAFRRPKAFADIIYFWLFFQLVIVVSHMIFQDWIGMMRLSPSYALITFVDLRETLNMPELKTFCNKCFPAGHALIAVFWARFSLLYSKQWLHKIIFAAALMLILPRLFSGAHWLSDIVFTICYASLYFAIAIGTPFFAFATSYIERFINIFTPKRSTAGAI